MKLQERPYYYMVKYENSHIHLDGKPSYNKNNDSNVRSIIIIHIRCIASFPDVSKNENIFLYALCTAE